MTIDDSAIERYLALSPRSYPLVSVVELRVVRSDDAPPRATLCLVLSAPGGDGEQLVLRFDRVQKLQLRQPEWSDFTMSYLSITPMRDRGMEGIGYRVHDEEEDSIDFLCDTFTCDIEEPRSSEASVT
jgi:hypothetical protein